ncbi:MAG: MbnP family protein [Schleiferiaceae bacterium]
MKKLPFYGLLSLLILAGCRPGDKKVTVEFQWIQNGTPYTQSTPFFKGDTAIAIDLFHFYISDLRAGDQLLSDVLFVDPSDSAFSTYTLDLQRRVDQISFGLGVPSDMNAMDPTSFETTHPLSSAYAMYWTWASKYRFLKAEGRFNAGGDLSNATTNGGIIWHTGTDPLYRTRTFDVPVRPGDRLVVKMDLDLLLGNVSLANDGFTHTTVDTYATAEKVSNQAIAAIEVVVE